MRKLVRTALCVVLGILGVLTILGGIALAATLSWTPPQKYTTGADIAPADQARIIYTPFTGPSNTGPWTSQPPTPPGATSATVPDPLPGTTMWYTLESRLDGGPSGKAVPVDKTVPFPVTEPATNLRVE